MNFIIEVELVGVEPLRIWRKLSVSTELSFEELHLVLQAAFGWENRHLYAFCERSLEDLITINSPNDEDAPVTADWVPIDKLFINLYNKREFLQREAVLRYIYDYGDHWEHLITVQDVEYRPSSMLELLDGEGDCPPEEIGGVEGYMKWLQHRSGGGESANDFQPVVFDRARIQERLRHLERDFIAHWQ